MPSSTQSRNKTSAPIFIGGEGRSGTRLLREILGKHPNVFEIKRESYVFIDSVLRSNHALVSAEAQALKSGESIGIISAVLAAMHYRKEVASKQISENKYEDEIVKLASELELKLELKDLHKETVFAAIADFLSQRDNKSRWVEKTPSNIYAADLIWDKHPDAKFIALYRDPRAVVASWLKKDSGKSLLGVIWNWNKAYRAISKMKQERDPFQVHALSYEALITRPETSLRELCVFLEENFNEGMLNASMVNRKDETKNQSGFDANAIDKWQENLSINQKILIDALTISAREDLGYANALGSGETSRLGLVHGFGFIFFFVREIFSLLLTKLSKAKLS